MTPLLPFLLLLSAAEPAERPRMGDVAPSFTAQASNGKTISLADYAGKKKVVLAFFPKAFTGG
jgi:peroxiredoxin Q/BCP